MEENQNIVLVAENAISTINYKELNKGEMTQIVKTVKQAVSEGFMDPIDSFIYAKKMAKLSDDLVKTLQPYAAGDFKGGKYERFSTEVTERDGGRYDYASSKDPEWLALKEQADEIKLRMSARETYLKGINQPRVVVDEQTGEEFTIYPPSKSEAMSIIVTIK